MKTKNKLRKWNNIIHRDIGYFFFGLTIIYAISGIAMNHKVMGHWNPEYIIVNKNFHTKIDVKKNSITDEKILNLLAELGEKNNLKKYYYSNDTTLKIYIKSGIIIINTKTGEGILDTAKKRPVFKQFNFLHYNPNIWWTFFSDIYATALLLLAITGLFVIRGKKGIKWRGAIIASIGLLIPILFLIIFA